MSGNQLTPVLAGSPAERLRSLLVAAKSLSLHTPGHRADLVGRHRLPSERLIVELPAVSCLARHLRQSGELVALVEVTDLAPVQVRDRVRARATLTGWLTVADGVAVADAELPAVLELATAELVTAGTTASIDPAAFAVARPDPLADSEADLLCHLDDHHPETVARLSRLVPPGRLHGVRQIRPLALDRFGIVLRLEHPDHDSDIRLCFPVPLHDGDQLADAVQAMLDGGRGCLASGNDGDRPGDRTA
ncbi:DUF2470 domain-containing protein [Plantactinospora sp. KLBMP9567]|uniref:DUF2470 domain-containing protein n=1 Tax=Plantactinospora sp. KLBMP9567 TaxID=3085900 RepID=UPI0029820748|nr:DUF2470 domain-containing protein [Plantactinospora sp. KLBMP9567]MDW5324997.1 DUF2470 domain-containing protein [Plantactinospora sp. KLBMP9567]